MNMPEDGVMPTREIPQILEDIYALTMIMDTFRGEARSGYTIEQRIEHHEQMITLLNEFRDADGDHNELPL